MLSFRTAALFVLRIDSTLGANPLAELDHRPWPLPTRPWIMVQIWRDLLFAHWSVPPATIRQLVPQQLSLDTFNGQAWLSITPFRMSLRLRALPPLPGMFDVPELNCRTYVTVEGKPGIYFFSLDIASRAAAFGARTFYHLPYFHARMRIERKTNSFSYFSSRGGATWRATYTPSSPPRHAVPDSLDYFLAERYCLYTVWKGMTYRGNIHHARWSLQDAQVKIEENTVAQDAGIELSWVPQVVSFARELKVLIWDLERLA
jgi:uncharacterized protein YqjF (DUF2071 family)